MIVCDRCKKVERYMVVHSLSFGLHDTKGNKIDGTYANFDIHLCQTCKHEVVNSYDILNCWKTLMKENKDGKAG